MVLFFYFCVEDTDHAGGKRMKILFLHTDYIKAVLHFSQSNNLHLEMQESGI
jgi:hypothetical protein